MGKNKRQGRKKKLERTQWGPPPGLRRQQIPAWAEAAPTPAQPEQRDHARPAGLPRPTGGGREPVSTPRVSRGNTAETRPGTAGCLGRRYYTPLPRLVGRHVGLTVVNCRKQVVEVGYYCCSSRAEGCFGKLTASLVLLVSILFLFFKIN